jgi:hypothetical protein
MPIKKYCSYTGCRVLLEEGIIYCDKHKKRAMQNKVYNDRRYSINRNDKKEQNFYRSHYWAMARDIAIAHYYGIDIYEYYTTGQIIEAETVHHIIPIKDDWSKRIDQHDLLPLTYANHRHIHRKYKNGEKKKTQDELFEMMIRFSQELRVGVQ